MSAERNVLRVVEYHANPARQLFAAVWMFCAGVVLLLIAREEPRFAYFFGWPALAASACFAIYFFWRRAFPGKPVLMLLPQGIIYRVGGVPQAFIPWQVVRGVDAIDFSVGHGKREVQVQDVTVILVPEDFYREYFHVGSLRRTALGWEWFFRPIGDFVGLAIHHEWFLLLPDEVREPIEMRWLAFRNEEPALPALAQGRSRFGRKGAHLVLGTRVLKSGWDVVKILAPSLAGLLVLAYLLGTM